MVAIKAPLPGTVLSILVKPGDAVEAYATPVVVLEAMKMENEISSEEDGVVKEILVKEGDAVSPDQDLVILE